MRNIAYQDKYIQFINNEPSFECLNELFENYNHFMPDSKTMNLNLLSQILQDFHIKASDYRRLITELVQDDFKAAENLTDLKRLVILIILLPELYEIYLAAGLEASIFYQTISDIILRINLNHQLGIPAPEFDWLTRIFRLEIFKLGELQFEFTRFDPATLPADIQFSPESQQLLKAGDPIISVHIMEDSNIHPTVSLKELDIARQFKADYFPDFETKYFYCYSWLLNPNNQAILPPDSKILAFADLFQIIAESPWPGMALERIFGQTKDSPKTFPQNTRLQKAAYLQQDKLGVGVGIIPI